MLPLSHDEVVHGKGSLIGKMPGDEWQQFANLRALFGYMWAHPGKKLLFMGGEFGQRREWKHEGELEWWVAEHAEHAGVQRWVADLNRLYRSEPALHELDFDAGRLRVDRRATTPSTACSPSCASRAAGGAPVLVVCNFTPVPRDNYLRRRAARAAAGASCSTATRTIYGGSGLGNLGGVRVGAGRRRTAGRIR